jgi:uncharacterized protein (TIGR01777 family)
VSDCGQIVIPGGAGHIGTFLSNALHQDGREIVVLSRSPRRLPWRVVLWDGKTLGSWTEELEGASAVINLAGRSVNCRYGRANRQSIRDSRIDSVRIIGRAVAAASRPPRVWLQAGTATIYAHRYDTPNDEDTGILGGSESGAPEKWRFSIDVARSWEQAFQDSVVPGVRKVLLRSAIVMSATPGGAFEMLLRLVRFGLGGRAGDGRQYVSWIHSEDFCRAITWLLEGDISGTVNLSSPNPLPNAEFMRALREAWGREFGLRAAEWMLEIGAFLLRTETELILKSRRVVPARLIRKGFSFCFPTWPEAARDLCERWPRDGKAPAKRSATVLPVPR